MEGRTRISAECHFWWGRQDIFSYHRQRWLFLMCTKVLYGPRVALSSTSVPNVLPQFWKFHLTTESPFLLHWLNKLLQPYDALHMRLALKHWQFCLISLDAHLNFWRWHFGCSSAPQSSFMPLSPSSLSDKSSSPWDCLLQRTEERSSQQAAVRLQLANLQGDRQQRKGEGPDS